MLEGSIRKVHTIVEETRSNVDRIVETGKDKVEAGDAIAKRCGTVLDEIVNNAVAVDKVMSEICGAAEEQAKGVAGISDAMNQLDQTTTQNANSAKKTSAISNDLMEQAEVLRTLVREFESEALGAEKGTVIRMSDSPASARVKKAG